MTGERAATGGERAATESRRSPTGEERSPTGEERSPTGEERSPTGTEQSSGTGERSSGTGEQSSGTGRPSPEFTRGDVFEALSNERRRYALHHLRWAGGPVGLGELSRQVAAWEQEVPVEDLTTAEVKRVRTALHQFHLPRLEDGGFVRYDRDRRAVALTDDAAHLRVYVEVVRAGDVPWALVYLGLAGVSGVLVLAAVAGVPPVASLPDVSFAAFAAVSFGVAAVLHTYVTGRMRLGAERTPPEVQEP